MIPKIVLAQVITSPIPSLPNLFLGSTILIQSASVPTPFPTPSHPTTVLMTSNTAIYLGINNPVGGVSALESSIGRQFALHLIYPGWTDLQHISDNPCPSTGTSGDTCSKAQSDLAAGRIPIFAWNCGDTNKNITNNTNPTQDDNLIIATAIAVKNFGAPVLIRWNWEFNDGIVGENRTACYDAPDGGVYGNDTTGPDGINGSTGTAGYFDGPTFVSAWRHIHSIFAAQGVTNAYWDWNPGDAGINNGSTLQWMNQFWPGSSYVDWIGFDAYDRTDNGVTNILDNVPQALPYPSPGQGAYPNATPYPTVTSTPNSAYIILTSLDANKPLIFNENGVHPDLQNSTPPPGGYTGAYQNSYFNGGTSPNNHTFLSLEQVLKNHPRFHGYAYFDKNNSSNPPPIGALDWLLFDSSPTGPFGTFANSTYLNLPAVP